MGIGAITNSYQVGYRGYESTGVAKADEKPTGLATIPYSDSLNETISENSVMDFAKIDWKDRTSETTLITELAMKMKCILNRKKPSGQNI